MGNLFGSKPKRPKPPPPPDPEIDEDAELAAKRESDRINTGRGRAATIVTGGLGDVNPAPTATATLLGS